MTPLEELQSHRGGLLRIKSQLFWYDGRGPDGAPGRVCLLLEAEQNASRVFDLTAAGFYAPGALAVLLLIDGCPYWVWVGPEDVEIL